MIVLCFPLCIKSVNTFIYLFTNSQFAGHHVVHDFLQCFAISSSHLLSLYFIIHLITELRWIYYSIYGLIIFWFFVHLLTTYIHLLAASCASVLWKSWKSIQRLAGALIIAIKAVCLQLFRHVENVWIVVSLWVLLLSFATVLIICWNKKNFPHLDHHCLCVSDWWVSWVVQKMK